MDKKQEKLIDSLIEHKKSLWTAFILLNGGLASLILLLNFPMVSLINFPKLFLLLVGLLLDYILFESLCNTTKRIDNNLK